MPACRVQSGCWEAAVASSAHGTSDRCALRSETASAAPTTHLCRGLTPDGLDDATHLIPEPGTPPASFHAQVPGRTARPADRNITWSPRQGNVCDLYRDGSRPGERPGPRIAKHLRCRTYARHRAAGKPRDDDRTDSRPVER